MSDLERTLREARASLPEPDEAATEHARLAVLGTPTARSRRRHLAAAALAFAAALADAFALGLVLAPGGATKTAANGPGFLPAAGWETFQTGLTHKPMAPTATAATVPLGHDVLEETFPWQTVATLQRGQLLLQTIFGYTGDIEGVDAAFPRRSLPLSLDDARSSTTLEGEPPNITTLRLQARVNNWNIDLLVFTRGRLRRQSGPQRRKSLIGSWFRGARLGRCRNALRYIQERPVPPLWKQLSLRRPRGWPTVTLSPGDRAQVFVQLRNWCVVPVKPVFFRAYLPGVGAPVSAPARVTLRCDEPQSPVSLSVGPVEPPTG